MECNYCKSELSVKAVIRLSVKGRATCGVCSRTLKLKNRYFIVFLLIVLALFLGVATYVLAASRAELGMKGVWNFLTLLIPWIILALIYGVLVVPAMEIEEES